MKSWQSLLVFVAIFAAVFFWRLNTAHAPATSRPPGLPEPDPSAVATLPGNDVSVVLGRGALIVDGDAADPIESVRLARADKPEQKIDFESQLTSSVKLICFFNVESGQHYFAEVKTKHRSAVRDLAARDKVEPVEIQRIAVRVRATNTARPNIVFSPDGELLAISTDAGELKVIPVFGGAERIKLKSKGMLPIAFSGDGSQFVTLECGEKTIVRCYDTRMGEEIWNKVLVFQNPSETTSGNIFVYGEYVWTITGLPKEPCWDARRLELKTGADVTFSQSVSDEGWRIKDSCAGADQIFVAVHKTKEKEAPFFVALAVDVLNDKPPVVFSPVDKRKSPGTVISAPLAAADGGKVVLVGLTDGTIQCLHERTTDGHNNRRWNSITGESVETPDGLSSCNAISICSLKSHACVVTGPAINRTTLASSWDSANSNACAIQLLELKNGRKLMQFPAIGIPRYCLSSVDGRWLAIAGAKGPPNPGEKQTLSLFDCSPLERGLPPRLTYTREMKDLGATFSRNGQLLAVVAEPDGPANAKDDEKTVDIVIIH